MALKRLYGSVIYLIYIAMGSGIWPKGSRVRPILGSLHKGSHESRFIFAAPDVWKLPCRINWGVWIERLGRNPVKSILLIRG